MHQTTEILQADANGLAAAVAMLRSGALVAFPTETVYGLGADARNGTAVARIFKAKDRPQFNPLIVHLADAAQALKLVMWNDTAQLLADVFWPGPLTLVLPLRKGHGLSSLVTAGLDTVGLRVPAGDTAQRLLSDFEGPVAAPSANPSGQISPTTAAHVTAGLSGRIAAILDGGPCSVGLESTIIGLAGDNPTLLRAGGISAEALETTLGVPFALSADTMISAPGQMQSHYAPRAAVRLNATTTMRNEILLGFGEIAGDLSLSRAGDLTEAAANLFDCLHQLDAQNRPIAVAPIPTSGLGAAINDRLRRAAAPR